MVHCTSICMGSKSVSQIFKILFHTGDLNNFVLNGVLSRYVQLKSSFSDEKTSAVKSETHFRRGAIKVHRGKVLKKNSIIGKSWKSAKLFIIQNYTDGGNGNVPWTVQNVWYFQFPLRSRCWQIKVFITSNKGSVKNNFWTILKESCWGLKYCRKKDKVKQ